MEAKGKGVATVEELQRALHDFEDRYFKERLIERHGWISRPEQHKKMSAAEAAA